MDLSGRLSTFPLADLLQWAFHDRCTGELVVRRSHREKRVFFKSGEILACFSDDPAEYYGRHLVLNEMLNKKQVVFALTYCQRRGTRLGVALQELGLLPPEEIQRTLRLQIEDSVCDLFLWRRGVFFFQEHELQEEQLLPEPISTLGLVLEGARWLDEYRRIRETIVLDDVLLLPGPNHGGERRTPMLRRIM